MKTFLLAAFALTTGLAQIASAKPEDQDQVKQPNNKQRHAQANQPKAVAPTPKYQRSPAARPPTPVYRPPQVNPAVTNQTARVQSIDQDAVRAYRPYRSPNVAPSVRPNQNVVTTPRITPPVDSNIDRNRVDQRDRNRNDSNWRNRNSNNNAYSWHEARRRHYRQHHDRSWWTSRYSRFALFGSGYYFWDAGYWYPAYGYDPGYNSYSYDEPIYGYNDLDPAQVIASVQTELQRLGYYRYAVDGEMGPATRAAIANYQRDTGLSITAAIDPPTLQSLGLE
jgi:hypothetical protein